MKHADRLLYIACMHIARYHALEHGLWQIRSLTRTPSTRDQTLLLSTATAEVYVVVCEGAVLESFHVIKLPGVGAGTLALEGGDVRPAIAGQGPVLHPAHET